MAVWVALLRGLNVGGNRMVPMARLRALCEELGFERPETLIQSGNVVFESEGDGAGLQAKLEAAIKREFGFAAGAILRTAEEVRALLGDMSFAEEDGARVMVTFLTDSPAERVCEAALALFVGEEQLRMHEREAVCFYPNGMGRSKLPLKLERLLSGLVTTRNRNTVEALLRMAEQR